MKMIAKIHRQTEVDQLGKFPLEEFARQATEHQPSDAVTLKSTLRPLPPDAVPFDTNGDDAVTTGEFLTRVFAELDRLDVNDDGIYEDSELK